jgi:hypothetical protein
VSKPIFTCMVAYPFLCPETCLFEKPHVVQCNYFASYFYSYFSKRGSWEQNAFNLLELTLEFRISTTEKKNIDNTEEKI